MGVAHPDAKHYRSNPVSFCSHNAHYLVSPSQHNTSAYLEFDHIVDPPINPGNITKCGDTTGPGIYVLQNDLLGEAKGCFYIDENDAWIDLNGYTVQGDRGSTDYGAEVEPGITNTSIYGGTITAFGTGIRTEGHDGDYYDLNLSDNQNTGISLVSGGGNNTINRLIKYGKKGIQTIAVNTDAQDLLSTNADRKLLIGKNITGGLGAGGDPEIGERSAEESKEIILI